MPLDLEVLLKYLVSDAADDLRQELYGASAGPLLCTGINKSAAISVLYWNK